MQVYANSFTIEGPGAYRAVVGAIHGWLKRILDMDLTLQDITKAGEYSNKYNELHPWLRSYVSTDGSPALYAWRLKHTDSRVLGRQWITEIGLTVTDNIIDFSCSVFTEELSTLVTDKIDATRPRVISYILKNIASTPDASVAKGAPGINIKYISTEDDFRALKNEIEREEREYPIVLVSSTRENSYLINIEHLQDALFGLAQIVVTEPQFNSYDMEEILGRSWSAWDGAINIIQTIRRNGRIHGKLLLSETILELGEKQAERVSYILALVTHTTNVPRLRNRLRPEVVSQTALRRRLESQTKLSTSDPDLLKQEIAMLWREVEELEGVNSQTLSKLDASELSRIELEEQIEDLDQRLRQQEYKSRALQNGSNSTAEETDLSYLFDFATKIDQPSPYDCLEFISKAFPEKSEILDSAWRSARGMPHFQNGRRLLRMLITLMTKYHEAIQAGGDNAAKGIFSTDEYSATESETVTSSKSLSSKRRFLRRDNEIEMFRHLKIGKADNIALTLRVHFEWIAAEKKIVIGYCGEHLPIASH